LYFLAIRLRWYAICCNSSSDVAIKIWSSAYSMVLSNFLFYCHSYDTVHSFVRYLYILQH
jgi:hypothetical protein